MTESESVAPGASRPPSDGLPGDGLPGDGLPGDGLPSDGLPGDGFVGTGVTEEGVDVCASDSIGEPYASATVQVVGVGPHPQPWPNDPRLDSELLLDGDRRNVIDEFRYWSMEAIVAELDKRRHPFHVAIENFKHDLNIGTVVRNANAFLAAEVHIIGRRRWNRRGAMVTDRYQHVRYHSSCEDLADWAQQQELPIVGIDNVPGSSPLETEPLPRACVLLFGQEGAGLSDSALLSCEQIRSIAMYGSTRSINAGVASGIAMYAWSLSHASERPLTAR